MPKNLLLADDSITIQKVVAITFAGEDVRITTVDNGEDAIARARELRPDVILADVVMPRRNGYEVCEAVKADPTLQHIPVLLLAGTFEAFDEGRARSARADGHIAKPFESQALINKVKELLGEKVAEPAARPSFAGAPAATAATAPRTQPARPSVPGAPPADIRPSLGAPAAARPGAAPGPAIAPRQPLPGLAAARPPGAMGVPSVPRPAVPQAPRPTSAAPAASAAGPRATPAPLAPGLTAPGARAPKPPSAPVPVLGSPRPVSPPLSAPRPAPIPTLQARPPAAAPPSGPSPAALRDPFGLDIPTLHPPAERPAPAPAGLTRPLPSAPAPAVLAATVGLTAKQNVAADVELDLAPALAPAIDPDWSDVDLTDIDEDEAPSSAGPTDVAVAMSAAPQMAKAEPEKVKAAPEPTRPALEPATLGQPAAAAPIATLEEIDFGDVASPPGFPTGAPGSSLDGKVNIVALEDIELTPLGTPAPAADEPRTLAAQLEELPELDAEDAIELPAAAEAAAKVEGAPAPGVSPAAARALERPVSVVPEATPPAPSKAPAPPSATAPAPQAADGGEALLREALSRASREVIERIAWEVVPQLAETILREQIERLAKERQR